MASGSKGKEEGGDQMNERDWTPEVEHPDVPPCFDASLQSDYVSLEDLDIIDAEWTEEDYAEATAVIVTPQQQQQQQEDEDTCMAQVEDLAAEVGHQDVLPPGLDASLYNSDYVSLDDFDVKYEETMEVEWAEEDYAEATAVIIPPQHQQKQEAAADEEAAAEASKILKKAEDGGD